ncbi:MAG: threonine/serine exporter family protein, partial [Oscillospiraceae bacterium]|nr:threonine/serine exporter family protein [Oscillospiraceae bacterium]
MDYDALLNLSTDLGYGLLESGAEIYRVEESIHRLLQAYGIRQADPFVIPNCIIVSFTTPDGQSRTQVRRMPSHGTDVDLLERYNDLCRHLCQDPPPLVQARERLDAIKNTARAYSLPRLLTAYFIATGAFCLLFGGNFRDALCSGICGLSIGVALTAMTRLGTNLFFKSMLGAALSAFLALTFVSLGFGAHSELIIIGALMALVPGIMFTNAIRDIMAGDQG